ncbi:MAG: DUF4114 domain-containing protein, partial [Gammaproteobacteria bacterium]|nr:DUF4114 domain-containing protein [Gammaproteobacteria bacterium]
DVYFVPNENWNGTTTFNYAAIDNEGFEDSSPAIGTINITPENDGPCIQVTNPSLSANIEEITTDYQFFLNNPLDILNALEETEPLPENLVNGLGIITLEETREVTVKFISEGAGYDNVFGYYTIAPDGSLQDPKIIWVNTNDIDSSEITISLGEFSEGTQIGFFVIANGADNFDAYTDPNNQGTLAFLNGSNLAKVTDNASEITLIFTPDGEGPIVITNHVYHSAATSLNLALNPDGLEHVVSGYSDVSGTDPSKILVGFEDLFGNKWAGSDRDFNDIILEVDVGEATARSINPALIAGNIIITDPDSLNLSSASIIIMNDKAGDQLTFSNQYSVDSSGNLLDISGVTPVDTGIDVTGLGTEQLALAGVAALDVYQDALNNIVFQNSNEIPDSGLRSINFAVVDDTGLNSNLGTAEFIVTEPIEDVQIGTIGPDTLTGSDVNDLISGLTGADQMYGGEGADILQGGPGADELYGEEGDDVLFGGEDADTLSGGIGNDILFGDEGNDSLSGGSGNDFLFGGPGADTLEGGEGNDFLQGRAEADILRGGPGNDILIADEADTEISGGSGIDTLKLSEGPGAEDTLNLSNIASKTTGVEVIDMSDFDALDRVVVDRDSVNTMAATNEATGAGLFIKGDAGDTVSLQDGTNWANTGTINVGGVDYDLYTNSTGVEDAVVAIQQGVDIDFD